MKFSSEIIINRSVQEVFRFTTSHKNLSRWVDGFQTFKSIKGRNRGEGSTATHIYQDSAGLLEVHEEVMEITSDKLFKSRLTHKNMDTILAFKFLNQGNSTKIITETKVRLKPAIFNLFSLFMKGQMKKQQQADLRKLKNVIEAGKG
jgi:polyketide cyclase/dehydrase/lipid transport protein